jgi:hypothetical protein
MLPHPDYSKRRWPTRSSRASWGTGIESTFQSQVYEMSDQAAGPELLDRQGPAAPEGERLGQLQLFQLHVGSTSAASASRWAIKSESLQPGGQLDDLRRLCDPAAKLSALENKRLDEQEKRPTSTRRSTRSPTCATRSTFRRGPVACRGPQRAHRRGGEAPERRQGPRVRLAGDDRRGDPDPRCTRPSSTWPPPGPDFLSHWTEFISLAGIDPALANISPAMSDKPRRIPSGSSSCYRRCSPRSPSVAVQYLRPVAKVETVISGPAKSTQSREA